LPARPDADAGSTALAVLHQRELASAPPGAPRASFISSFRVSSASELELIVGGIGKLQDESLNEGATAVCSCCVTACLSRDDLYTGMIADASVPLELLIVELRHRSDRSVAATALPKVRLRMFPSLSMSFRCVRESSRHGPGLHAASCWAVISSCPATTR
jgi:hypothetical protein